MKTIFVAANILALIAGIICARPVWVAPVSRETILVQVTPTPIKPAFKTRWDEIVYKVEHIAKEYDLPPSVPLAIAALESGHGTSYYCREQNNCCGYMGGFKPFATLDEGLRACVRLLAVDTIYAKAYSLRGNPYQMLVAIQEAGYANTTNYADKVSKMPEFIHYSK